MFFSVFFHFGYFNIFMLLLMLLFRKNKSNKLHHNVAPHKQTLETLKQKTKKIHLKIYKKNMQSATPRNK